MDKMFAIIKREYLTRVKSKGFLIGTILSPLIMMGFAVMPVFLARSSGPEKYRITVLDQNGDASLVERIAALLEPKRPRDPKYDLIRETIDTDRELEARKLALTADIESKKIDGYLILQPDIMNREEVVCYAKNSANFSNRSRLGEAINRAISESRIAKAGLKPENVRELTKTVSLRMLNERGENDRGKVMLGFALLMILYVTILIYGVTVMRGVMEEKQSRIIEVLLASVKPFDLMLGKVIGIGLVGLTQYLVWAVSGLFFSLLTAGAAIAAMGSFTMPKISVSLMIFFVVYYLLGYFLYATLYAMVGAIVSNEDDGNQLQMPISMTFAVSLVLATLVMENPSGTPATLLSLFPYFGPALMFLRIAFNAAPAWQIALSIGLMLLTILGSVWLAARIYRVGMLMYGKRPTLPELFRWLKYS